MKTPFQGKFMVAQSTPQIGFLEGDFGREFLQEYNRRVEEEYGNNQVLRVLTQEDNLVKGSNPFAVVLANQILREGGLRTATQPDLEMALISSALQLRETSVDTGLVLRSETDPNKYLASDLAKQLRARSVHPQFEYPILVDLKDLT